MDDDDEFAGRLKSQWEEEREAFVEAIVNSDARKNLIVAGPGTGKTRTFRKLVESGGGPNLVLTFIRNLVGDLTAKLGNLADVYTFHGFCAKLVYELRLTGLSAGPNYYPPLLELVCSDLEWLGSPVDRRDVEDAFHDLDEGGGLIADYIRSGDYYDAVSHSDAVYRVLRHLESHPEGLPAYHRVMVDEYQDFSLLEVSLIDLLARKYWTLIVGDDDQALYAFKRASPEYIRALDSDQDFVRFELPYCSRCTRVMVDSVHRIIEAATREGRLRGRIGKQFALYEPSKSRDSEQYPLVVHAHCSVQTTRAPYMARYIVQRVNEIPAEEVAESYDDDFPTALVVGPRQFSDQMATLLPDLGVSVVEKRRKADPIDLADAYRRLGRDPSSRLGWRIALYVDPLPDLGRILQKSLIEGDDLADLIPGDFRTKHLAMAELFSRAAGPEALSPEEVKKLAELGLVPDDVGASVAEVDGLIPMK